MISKNEFNIRQARISDVIALSNFYMNLDDETRRFYRFLLCNNAFQKIICFFYLFLRLLLNGIIYLGCKRYLLMFLVFYHNNIAGVCHISISGKSGIYGIVVDKKYRGKGLSYILSEKTILSAAKYGVRGLILTVDEDNTLAISLYKKLSFRSIGACWDTRIVNSEKVSVRAIVMERKLKC